MRVSTRPYADPYVAGIALGFVLLAAFVVMGRGLGASGAFASAAAATAQLASGAGANRNAFFSKYLSGGSPWMDWLVFELIGVVIGGAVSAWLAGRLQRAVDRGPRIGVNARLGAAFGGGTAMGVGAVLARGCTSGQALTGGALLSAGSWTFMVAAFAGAYAAAPLLRRLWT